MQTKQHTLPEPTECDNCCSLNIEYTSNAAVYGKKYGDWPYCYYCSDCKAAVGCHAGTRLPLGRMADRATRQLRLKAHKEFDLLWNGGLMTRSKAYSWLAGELEIDSGQCHISWFSKDQLRDVATLSANYYAVNRSALAKRRIKQEKANAKPERSLADKRTAECIKRRKSKRRS